MLDLFQSNFVDDKGAEFSECGKYRYRLWRIWELNRPLMMVIGLNPSKADASVNDNTITKIIKIAKYNWFGGIYMLNCFPLISTDPDALIGTDVTAEMEKNEKCLIETAAICKEVVFAWGNFEIVSDTKTDIKLIKMFPDAKVLWINKNGSPKHPLYCKDATLLIPYYNVE